MVIPGKPDNLSSGNLKHAFHILSFNAAEKSKPNHDLLGFAGVRYLLVRYLSIPVMVRRIAADVNMTGMILLFRFIIFCIR